MRTHNVVNRMKEIFSGERDYIVKGEIGFVFTPRSLHSTDKLNLEVARNAILSADEKFPWSESETPESVEFKSIKYLTEVESVKVVTCELRSVSNGGYVRHGQQFSCWFKVVPQYDSVRKSQVYAYEKYLARLAEEIAKMKPEGVASVHSILRVSTICMTYKVEN